MSSDGRRWFEQRKEFTARPPDSDGAPERWTKCVSCSEMLFDETLAENQSVCPHCAHHYPIDAHGRLALLCDEGSFTWHDEALAPVDALGFVDSKAYKGRIEATRRSTGRNDAFVAASATIEGVEVEVGSFDFRFMGGSMGSVVGEMITRLYERANDRRVPAIVVSASGGARMQEGVLSLMQMAKTCAALARLKDEARMPYVSVLTHPTTGGVAASFAMLGDIILAEPRALIGFAGPRVIQQTIGGNLPDGFQTSEYLLEHGMVDHIVQRSELRPLIAQILRALLLLPPGARGRRPESLIPRSVSG
ncbi:MAG: acetyl-CoA carboxylase carboxyltransferase subunit beta [Deltaproteobacteria bacterium]|nr:acetyl-CoA carboxylase carboxyltransferase subunit beta [Deltaproteobacteria bacterium]